MSNGKTTCTPSPGSSPNGMWVWSAIIVCSAARTMSHSSSCSEWIVHGPLIAAIIGCSISSRSISIFLP